MIKTYTRWYCNKEEIEQEIIKYNVMYSSKVYQLKAYANRIYSELTN